MKSNKKYNNNSYTADRLKSDDIFRNNLAGKLIKDESDSFHRELYHNISAAESSGLEISKKRSEMIDKNSDMHISPHNNDSTVSKLHEVKPNNIK
jgi:hypothetical protein